MTFQDIYRALRLYVPGLPIMLAQQIVNQRYAAILDLRSWAGLRTEGTIEIAAPLNTGTVTATQGSTSVTFTGAALTTAVVGRQLKINNQAPILDITAFDVGTQVATISPAWPLADATNNSYTIANIYITMPSDFKQFLIMVDPIRQWQLRTNVVATEINAWDPARTNVGDPWAIADLSFSSTGVPRYELWPGPSTQRGLTYIYQRQGAQLLEMSDTPIYPLRGTELFKGALADLTKWPGTADVPNPLFTNAAQLYPIYEADFQNQISHLERQDDDLYLSSWILDRYGNLPYAPYDSKWMQNHAFPAGPGLWSGYA